MLRRFHIARALFLPTWLLLPRQEDTYCPCCSKSIDGAHAALCSLYGRALLIDPAHALMQPDHPVFYAGRKRREWCVDMR